MLNRDTFSENYRASHQSAEIVADYVDTFEVGYCAALWRKVEQHSVGRCIPTHRPCEDADRSPAMRRAKACLLHSRKPETRWQRQMSVREVIDA